ncbi:hypothetical protein Ae201684P_000480 [Aphanomyces euteiches]|uniref:Uncharacterized protein n=1 Tax=Aphanomyces euteiches TaxID=100861 RepID=A0A6G0XAT9_9STRA|nr:hypothetical protein Ae201684_006850 [Aphanomyces euteiches]KAH9087067.1 hypothetical protein Ae201684P_000480 [Aphanomyces euteiches]KAH9141052.1 hypothetical protein AeRB84_014735 [Aphanomyces euteiches]
MDDKAPKPVRASRRLSSLVRTVKSVHAFNATLKARVKRRAGWSRKHVATDDITRHCQSHMERLGCLPPLSIEIKIDPIKKAVRKSLKFKAEWTGFYWNKFFFRSPLMVPLITDLFWWASLDFFARDGGIRSADSYVVRIESYVHNQVSVNYAKLLTKILYTSLPTGAADEFLDYFPYCLSRTIYKAMQKAHPEFIRQMRSTCPAVMIEAISLWTTGIAPPSESWKGWRRELETMKLRHGPKPTMSVREVLNEMEIPEEILSDDSNDGDSLTDEETKPGHIDYDVEDESDDSDAYTDGMVDFQKQFQHAEHIPVRSRISLKFSPAVDRIMQKYKYTGCRGRNLGYTMTVTDPSSSTVIDHIEQHEAYLDHLEKELPEMRARHRDTLTAQSTAAHNIATTFQTKTTTCEFEIENPVANARLRRLSQAKNRQQEHEHESGVDAIHYKPSALILSQKLDQQLKMGNNYRRRVNETLQPIR